MNRELRVVLNQLIELKNSTEVKTVRHVRTPDGEKLYGQPIGSVIVADKIKKTNNLLTNIRFLKRDEDNKLDVYRGSTGQTFYVLHDKKDGFIVADENYDEVFSSKDEDVAMKWMDDTSKHKLADPERGNRKPPKGYHLATIAERKANPKIAPAWVDVFISNDPKASRMVIGRDGSDRIQSVYSSEHTLKVTAAKFLRIKKIQKFLPAMDKGITNDWYKYDEASALMLIRKMGFRPGGEGDTRSVAQAYGAITLEARHIKINKDSITFDFTGKKGVRINLNTKDKEIYSMITTLMKGKSGRERLFPDMTPVKVNDYMNEFAPDDFTLKDLRTVKANEIALSLVKNNKTNYTNKKDFRGFINDVGDAVAEKLGNTRSVTLKKYVNPMVFAPISDDPSLLEEYIAWTTDTLKKEEK